MKRSKGPIGLTAEMPGLMHEQRWVTACSGVQRNERGCHETYTIPMAIGGIDTESNVDMHERAKIRNIWMVVNL